MKTYRTFLLLFISLLTIYVVAELNKPTPRSWNITLSNTDKNPFGAYILYHELNQLFPNASRQSFRIPAYDLLNRFEGKNNVYFLISPGAAVGKADRDALLNFVKQGNFVFLSSLDTGKPLMDTLGLEVRYSGFLPTDTTGINFTNPRLKAPKNFRFKSQTIDQYFSKLAKKDSTLILGVNQNNDANFVKVNYGNGAFYVHAAPLCFSNYFMLYRNNQKYVAGAISYLPAGINNIFWDEYYKLGRTGPTTPLRMLLSNPFLTWALRLLVVFLVLYVLFEMKRRQRIIPVIEPLRNSSVDFVKTVASLYYNQHDNRNIAEKKIQYWMEYIRQHYYLSAQLPKEDFTQQLAKKSGVSRILIETILSYARLLEESSELSDSLLLQINHAVDSFYQSSQS